MNLEECIEYTYSFWHRFVERHTQFMRKKLKKDSLTDLKVLHVYFNYFIPTRWIIINLTSIN